MNQSKLEVTTRSRPKARENMRARVTIGFGFTSDWLKKWREIFNQSLSVVNAKPRQLASYFRHSTEKLENGKIMSVPTSCKKKRTRNHWVKDSGIVDGKWILRYDRENECSNTISWAPQRERRRGRPKKSLTTDTWKGTGIGREELKAGSKADNIRSSREKWKTSIKDLYTLFKKFAKKRYPV